jgi:hypothetical protein
MKKLILFLSLVAISSSYGAFTVNMDAGLLKGPGGADTMVSDSTPPSTNGSLLLLIDEGAGNTLSNSLAPGQYVSGNNTILAAGGFNSNSGTHDETFTVFNFTNGTAGDLIALRWFPNITLAQYQANATPSAGQTFGSYNPLAAGNGTNSPDGGDPWALPSSGTINLNFFTTDDAMGSQLSSRGFANFTVIPEPSVFALLAVGTIVAPFLSRRKKS